MRAHTDHYMIHVYCYVYHSEVAEHRHASLTPSEGTHDHIQGSGFRAGSFMSKAQGSVRAHMITSSKDQVHIQGSFRVQSRFTFKAQGSVRPARRITPRDHT